MTKSEKTALKIAALVVLVAVAVIIGVKSGAIRQEIEKREA